MIKLVFTVVTCGLLSLGFSGGLFSDDGQSLAKVRKGPQKLASSKKSTDFETAIRPLLVNYCANCHAPGDMQGLDFLAAMNEADVAKHRGLFADVAEQIENRKMPPKGVEQPTETERELMVQWLKRSLDLKPSDTDRISPYVVEVYEDRKGNLWFGTMNDGVARYDNRQQLVYFTEADGLPSNAASSFAEDKEGNLWVGTQNGVCKFDGARFNRIGKAVGLPTPKGRSTMSSAGVSADSKGNIWVSVASKLYRHNGQSFNEFKLPIAANEIESYAILAGDATLALEDKAGNQWFGTDGYGAFMYDGTSFTHFTKEDGLCSNNINKILEDKNGNLWFACMQSYQPEMTGDGGVCRFDGTSFTSFPNVKGLHKNDIYTIYETRAGDVWIGASGVGAYRFDGKRFTLFSETNMPHRTRNFGLQDMLESRNGTLWFGFSGGLFRFNGKSFFNVTKKGPWKGLPVAMAAVAAGAKPDGNWYHPKTYAALSALAQGEFDKAKTILRGLKATEPAEPTIQERILNQVGYELIFTKHLDRAINVFKINTLLYPNEFNTFDSLAEAYHRKGDEKSAVDYYQKSLELNPDNKTAVDAIKTILARQEYESILVAPQDWIEEVIVCPPSFAPTMSLTGIEHLRLPPEFRNPDSDWFLSYLFAIELTEPSEVNEELIGEQLLCYFRGLASGRSDKQGKEIETEKFTIETKKLNAGENDGKYRYVLTWREPFAGGTPLRQNIRVKVFSGRNQHGIVFVCGSPQPLESDVWADLLKIRNRFEERINFIW